MADVKWIKITTDIFDDEKILLIESLPEADSIIVIWFKLLCLAGKMNNSGVFMMNEKIAYTDKMLATIFRRKESTVQLALQTFEQFGMVEIIDGVITIPNWGKHQNLEQLEERKKYQREYQREYREKQKLLAENDDGKNSRKHLRKHLREHNVNTPEEEKEEDKNKKKKKEIIYSSVPELNDAILSFIEFRKKIRKPMTDRAVELMINKLNKIADSPPEQIEILNQSIMNGWTGIFPLKKGAESNGRNTERASETTEYGTYL